MTYNKLLFCLSLWSMLLAGCSITQSKQEVYHYALSLPSRTTGSASTAQTTASPASLVVRPFTAHQPYNRDRIVYRSSPYQVDFYHYHRWVSKPADMVTTLTRRALQQSHLFSTVYPTPDAPADMRLGGVIRQCEEIDQAQSWQAVLSIDVWLSRSRNASPFWFETYTATQQASKRNPAAVAEAMSRNLQEILQQLSADLATELATLPRPRAQD